PDSPQVELRMGWARLAKIERKKIDWTKADWNPALPRSPWEGGFLPAVQRTSTLHQLPVRAARWQLPLSSARRLVAQPQIHSPQSLSAPGSARLKARA